MDMSAKSLKEWMDSALEADPELLVMHKLDAQGRMERDCVWSYIPKLPEGKNAKETAKLISELSDQLCNDVRSTARSIAQTLGGKTTVFGVRAMRKRINGDQTPDMRHNFKVEAVVDEHEAAPVPVPAPQPPAPVQHMEAPPPAPGTLAAGEILEALRAMNEVAKEQARIALESLQLMTGATASLFNQYQQVITLLSEDNRANRKINERLSKEKAEVEQQARIAAASNVEDAVEIEEKRQNHEMQRTIFEKLSMVLPALGAHMAGASGPGSSGGSSASPEMAAITAAFGSMTEEQFMQIGSVLTPAQQMALGPIVEKVMKERAAGAQASAVAGGHVGGNGVVDSD